MRIDAHNRSPESPKAHAAPCAAIFDLDGVLTDTAELHYQSWLALTRTLGIPFDRVLNDRLRGIGRRESLEIVLGARASEFPEAARQQLAETKNEHYLRLVSRMTPGDACPGVQKLLETLRQSGWRLAVASSSRNAEAVLQRLELRAMFHRVIDGNRVPESKPDPRIFLTAAAELDVPPAHCVVIEDAESGVAAARAAGMSVIGIGPPSRVGAADRVFPLLADCSPSVFDELVRPGRLADQA